MGGLSVAPALVLSPMSGVTTCSFRRLIKELNPGSVGMVVTEFISVEAMTRQVPRTLSMMRYVPEERPFAIQIFGYDINRMRDSAMMCQDAGVDLVDINCGCPAPKVVRKGGGCELMRQPEHLTKIVREVRKAITIPLTIKFRSGWDATTLNAPEIARIAESEGVNGVTIHGRTRAQLYRGEADWDLVSRIKSDMKIPVCGSGDVVDLASAVERFNKGVDGLFIGRAAMSNPYIFSEITTGNRVDLKKDPLRAISIIERYIELLSEEFSPKASIGKVKQLASQMCRGHEWRKPLITAKDLKEQKDILAKARGLGGLWPRASANSPSVPPDEDTLEGAL